MISPQCSARLSCVFSWVLKHMDSEFSSFQSGLLLPVASVPPRRLAAMPAGDIVAWTPARMLAALGAWLMEETQLPAPIAVSVSKRRA
jgi:hypothetical protein